MKKRIILMAIVMAMGYGLSAQDVILNGQLYNQHLYYDDEEVLINTSSGEDTEFTGIIGFSNESGGRVRVVGTESESVYLLPIEFHGPDEHDIMPFAHLSGSDIGIIIEALENREIRPLAQENKVETYALQVFPNPATDELSLVSEKGLSGYQIYDLQGRLLEQRGYEQTRRRVAVDLRAHRSGTYIVQLIESDGRTISKKIVKQ